MKKEMDAEPTTTKLDMSDAGKVVEKHGVTFDLRALEVTCHFLNRLTATGSITDARELSLLSALRVECEGQLQILREKLQSVGIGATAQAADESTRALEERHHKIRAVPVVQK